MTTTKKEILDFINELNKAANFHDELSFWWSAIMEGRFSILNPENKITFLFNPTEENFAITINDVAYNTFGIISPSDINNYISWATYRDNQPIKANEILRTKAYLIRNEKTWENLCVDFFSSKST